MKVQPTADQDFSRIVEVLNSIQEERGKTLEELARLLKIETVAIALLKAGGQERHLFESLAKACDWKQTENGELLLDDPWDRKLGRKYIAKVSTLYAAIGEVVEVLACVFEGTYSVKNLATCQIFHGLCLDKDSWRLPTAEENAPKPDGTLVTDFDSLKTGDVIRRETKKDGFIKAKILRLQERADGERWYTTEILEGDWRRNTIDPVDVSFGHVRLLSSAKRKPYVRDGRWVAEVGDRFKSQNCWARTVEVTKVWEGGIYACRTDSGNEGAGWNLFSDLWEPVS